MVDPDLWEVEQLLGGKGLPGLLCPPIVIEVRQNPSVRRLDVGKGAPYRSANRLIRVVLVEPQHLNEAACALGGPEAVSQHAKEPLVFRWPPLAHRAYRRRAIEGARFPGQKGEVMF